jgi:FkbM family methyltransferase
LGARFRVYFTPHMIGHETNFRSPQGVDHFEWKAVLESVESAGDSYVMVELGAGFGWWGINAAAALNRNYPGKPGRIILVEAEPRHYEFLETAVADNPLPNIRHDTMRAAVGPADRRDWFYTGRSADWYGQRLMLDYHREHLESGREQHVYRQGSKLATSDGYELSQVEVVPLQGILESYGQVDLVDIDIQGTELEVIRSTPRALLSNCRRLFISTHSEEIHAELLDILGSDWDLAASFLPKTTVQTDVGPVELLDGVQHWKRR